MKDAVRFWGPRSVAAVFLLLWLGPGLLPGRHLTVEAYLSVYGAWHTARAEGLPLPVITDQSCMLFDYPALVHAHRSWKEGTAPRTLPVGAGVPFLGNPQTAAGSLWHMPMVVTGDLGLHSWFLLLKAWLAAALAWLLARRLGLAAPGAVVVSAATAAGGMMASQFLMTNTAPMVLLPLLMLFAVEASRRAGWKFPALFGGVAGLAPLWGHPEPAFFAVVGAGLFWVVLEIQERGWSPRAAAALAGRMSLAAGVCFLVAAPAILPFLVLMSRSVSYKTEMSPSPGQWAACGLLLVFAAAVLGLSLSLRGRRLLTAVAGVRPPWLWWGATALFLVAASVLLDPYDLVNPGAFPRGHASNLWHRLTEPSYLMHFYPGLVLVFLVPRGWRRMSQWRWPLTAMFLLGVGLGWTLPPFDLVRLLPGLWTLTPLYGGHLMLIPLCLWGAAGLEELARRPRDLWVPVSLGCALAGAWQLYRARGVPPLDQVMLEPRAVIAALLGGMLLLTLWLLPRRAAAIVVGLVLVDLYLHAYPFARPMPAWDFPRTPPIRVVQSALEEGGRFVALTDPLRPAPSLIPPNTAAVYGLSDARVFFPVRPRELMELWKEVGLEDPHPNLLLTAKADSVVWDLLDVRVVMAPSGTPVPDRYRRLYGDSVLDIWSRPPLGEGEAAKTFALAVGDHGIVATTRDRGGLRRSKLDLQYTASDRWAGMAGPPLLLLGVLVLLGAFRGPLGRRREPPGPADP